MTEQADSPVLGESVVMDFETFAAVSGCSRQDVGDAALHRSSNRMPRATWERLMANQSLKDEAWLVRRAALRVEYDLALERGELQRPSLRDRLTVAAAGMADHPRTQAARRLLEKLPGAPA